MEIMIILLCFVGPVIGVISGAIASTITKGKGRSSGEGWALGLLLGFLGLIIAAVLPRDEQGYQRQQLGSGLYKQCRHCRQIIPRPAQICSYCRLDPDQ